jgi:hypothetical protein
MGTQWEFHWNNKNPTPKKKNDLRPLVHATSSPWLQDHYCLPMSFPIFGLGEWWGHELCMSFIKKQKRSNILEHSWILGSWFNRLCAKLTSNPLAL